MSDDDLRLLEPFYAAERSQSSIPADVEARMFTTITRLALENAAAATPKDDGTAASPGPPRAGPAMMSVPRAVAGMVASAIVAGIGGALIATAVHEPPAPVVSSPMMSAPAAALTSSVAGGDVHDRPVDSSVGAGVAPSARAASAVRPSPANDPTTLAAERALLDEARVALNRGEAEVALSHVARHENMFRHGHHVEEREAIAIRSLAAAGQTTAARARAERFFVAYPKSPAIPAIRAALE